MPVTFLTNEDKTIIDQSITQLSEEIAAVKEGMYETFDVSGSIVNFDVKTSGSAQVKGEYTTDSDITATLVHYGGNVLDVPSTALAGGMVMSDDGWITIARTQEEATNEKYLNLNVPIQPTVLPGKKYKVLVEFGSDDGFSDGTPTFTYSQRKSFECVSSASGTEHKFDKLGVYGLVFQTKDSFDSVTHVARSFVYFPAGCYGSVKLRMWLEIANDSETMPGILLPQDGEAYCPYDATVYTHDLTSGHTGEYAWPDVAAIRGNNTLYVSHGMITAHVKASLSGGEGVSAFNPTDYGLPVLTLDGDCAGMTKDDYVSLAFTFMGMSGNVDVKKQGSSSINTGVAIGGAFDTDVGGIFNFTLKFPEAFEAKDGWGEQKKYVFKANAIDHSHCRNVVSCKLWGQIVKSRANVPTELSSLPNGGAIDGFPIIIVLNGKFYALGTFNIPKDGWMFGSPKAILCADKHVDATNFRGLANLTSDFELEYVEDEDNADWVLTSLNTAIQAVIDSDGSDLDAKVSQYIDIPSAIDYFIHAVHESATDCTDKNYILVTFDGVKWYFSDYDRDSTYGLYWDGTQIVTPIDGVRYTTYGSSHRVMKLIKENKATELKARAVELRNGVLSEANVATVFYNFAGSIPAEVYAQNCKRWPLLRNTSVSNVEQILNWYRMRMAYIAPLTDALA